MVSIGSWVRAKPDVYVYFGNNTIPTPYSQTPLKETARLSAKYGANMERTIAAARIKKE